MRAADLGRLLFLSSLWGFSFIFIRIAAPALGPIVLVAFRVLIAGLILLVYARITHARLEIKARWKQYLMIGALGSAIPFVLISTAELHLPASLAAILNATTPLFGAVIAALWIEDALTPAKVAGLVLGVLGVSIVVGWSPLELSGIVMLSIGASLLAAAFYGLSGVFTKVKAAGARPVGMAVGSQLGAALLLIPLVPFALPNSRPSVVVVLCFLALAVLCTALAYLIYFRLIVDVGPTKALTVTFLVPVFAVAWGAIFLAEPLTGGAALGCAVVLAGTALVTGVRLGALWRAVTAKAPTGRGSL